MYMEVFNDQAFDKSSIVVLFLGMFPISSGEKLCISVTLTLISVLILSISVSKSLSSLREKIQMARHSADSVRISIGNDWEEPGSSCIRTYRVNLTSGTSNRIGLVYAVSRAEHRDGLLAYLPSSMHGSGGGSRNFLAIEMVDRKIRFLWDNGAGTRAITHNVTIDTANNLAKEDHMWYKIEAERYSQNLTFCQSHMLMWLTFARSRIGNIGRLNVRKVKPVYDRPEFHRWIVGESAAGANVLDLHPDDLLYIGGVPDVYRSPELQSHGRFVGTLYEISVNGENLGLWNFVSNRGCKETFTGVSDRSVDHNCYTFNGRGYATQSNIRDYDPRYLSVSMEFRYIHVIVGFFRILHSWQISSHHKVFRRGRPPHIPRQRQPETAHCPVLAGREAPPAHQLRTRKDSPVRDHKDLQ